MEASRGGLEGVREMRYNTHVVGGKGKDRARVRARKGG